MMADCFYSDRDDASELMLELLPPHLFPKTSFHETEEADSASDWATESHFVTLGHASRTGVSQFVIDATVPFMPATPAEHAIVACVREFTIDPAESVMPVGHASARIRQPDIMRAAYKPVIMSSESLPATGVSRVAIGRYARIFAARILAQDYVFSHNALRALRVLNEAVKKRKDLQAVSALKAGDRADADTIKTAEALLRALPADAAIACVSVSSDGEIGLSWLKPVDRFEVMIEGREVAWVSKVDGVYHPGEDFEFEGPASFKLLIEAFKQFYGTSG